MKLFVRSDLEGFFAFGLDAMLALLLMSNLLIGFLGFSPELVFGRIVPASAVGLLIGNGFYTWQALRLAAREKRTDVCAIPYGTSTLTMVIYTFLVMFPAQQKALADGLSPAQAEIIAWHTGLLACMCSGAIEFFGAFVVHHIRRAIPRVVMLVAVAGTGLVFLSMDYALRTFAHPLVGMASLALLCVFYFGDTRPKLGIPGGFVILFVGTALAWVLHLADISHVVPGSEVNLDHLGLNLPYPEIGGVFDSFAYLVDFLPIIIPFGFIFLIGSLQNIEGAAAAGDTYEPRPLLLMNGVGSFGAAAFGSPFPTSIFLGHPGYKKIGARAGYSLINGGVWTLVCFTGTLSLFTFLIPVEAIMALIIWIGVVVCAQNFQVAQRQHIPAVVIGLLPAFAAYVSLAVKHALAMASTESGINFFTPGYEQLLVSTRGFYAEGVHSLGQGYIYTCMIFAAVTYYVIERRFPAAAAWCLVGAALSAIGFIHLYTYTGSDAIGRLALPVPIWSKWTTGYLLMALIFIMAPLYARETKSQISS